MTLLRRTLLVLLIFFLTITLFSWWLLSTESGTRFLVARTSGFLPQQLTIADVSGTLRSRLSIQGIRWRDETADVRVQKAELQLDLWALVNETVAIESLQADTVRIVLTPGESSAPSDTPFELDLPIGITLESSSIRDIHFQRINLERQVDAIGLSASIDGADLSVSSLTVDSDWLQVAGSGRVQLQGRIATHAVLDWEYLALSDWPLAGQLEVGGDLDLLALEHQLRLPVAVTTSGELAMDAAGISARLSSSWDAVELERLGIASSEGTLNIDGTLDEIHAELSTAVQYANVPETNIDATSRIAVDGMRGLTLNARNVWGRSTLRGEVLWQEALRVALAVNAAEIAVANIAPDLSGTLAFDGQLDGRMADGAPDMQFNLTRLDGDLNAFPVNGIGNFRFRSGELRIGEFITTVGANRVTAKGRVGDPLDLSVVLEGDRLQALHPELDGAVSAALTIAGEPKDPRFDLRLSSDGMAWQGTPVDALTLTATGSRQQHAIDMSARAFATDLRLATTGRAAADRWQGEVQRLTIAHDAAGAWSLEAPLDLSVASSGLAIEPFCLAREGGEGKVCGRVAGGASTAFELSVESLPVAMLPLQIPAAIRAQGDIFATLRGDYQDDMLNGDMRAEIRNASVVSSFDDESFVTQFSALRLSAAVLDNRLTADSSIETGDGRLAIEASIDDVLRTERTLSGTARLDVPDISSLRGLLPALSNPQGKAFGELRFSGPLETPAIAGSLELQDGQFGIRVAGITVRELNASISQDVSGSLKLNASAISGDGTIELRGETLMADNQDITTSLQVTGERFELARTANIQAVASPDITIMVAANETRVSGQLGIPQASVVLREIPATAVRASPDAVVYRSDDSANTTRQHPIQIDVAAVFGEQVSLSAFGLNTRLQGNLQLRGDASKTINGYGRVSLAEGRYKAYGQALSIERGELIFNGPLDRPQLDIRAIRDAGEVIAGIQVRGTPDALQSDVFSRPALRDIEALSYLLTGRPLDQDNRDGDLLGEAAFALGLSGAGAITSRVRSNLGLDTLSIQGGANDGRIVAGKRLNDRLLVEYGYGIIDRLGTLLLRYQLNERLVLESRTGAVSNLDLVYRVRKQ